MARRRMIDPHFWCSLDVRKLTHRQRLLAVGLFSIADDEGRGIAHPAYIRSQIFPYDDITIREIEEDLKKIEEHLSIRFYEVKGNRYYVWLNWEKWQRVDKPQPSILPEPEDAAGAADDEFETDSGTIPEPVENDSKSGSGIIPELVENDSENDSRMIPESFETIKERKSKEIFKGKEGEGEENLREGGVGEGGIPPAAPAAGQGLLLKQFEENLGRPLSPLEVEQVLAWGDEYSPEVVREALKRAVLNNKRSMRYIGRILDTWRGYGLKTLADVLEYERAFEERRAGQRLQAAASSGGMASTQRDPPAGEGAAKVIALEKRRRKEAIRAARDYIVLLCGENPPLEEARRLAEGYGEDLVPEILSAVYGGEPP